MLLRLARENPWQGEVGGGRHARSVFRWFAVPRDLPAGATAATAALDRQTGGETAFRASAPGHYAPAVPGYERLGGTDPCEVRIEAAEGDLLDYMQYEVLMNMLALRSPAGVEISIWPIRRFHVASDEGTRVALDPSDAHTCRPFRRPRRAGPPEVRGGLP